VPERNTIGSKANSVIVLELNELTPALMDRFIAEGHLPGFAKLRREATVCITDAEEEPPNLEPWIQWVTVHTGLGYDEHRVFNLGDAARCEAPRIWDIVSRAGKSVWVCGSMNGVCCSEEFNGLFLPDPWTPDVLPQPEALFRPYYNLVRHYVQEYTRDTVPLSTADRLNFIQFMVRNGLSVKTVIDTLHQLTDELKSPAHWRRAAILDRLQWDVFRHHWTRLKPTFATFFLNSTAHYQHYYWRHYEPDRFMVRPSEEDRAAYAAAILFGYRKMDRIVQEALDLAGDTTTIVLCTALSQQPNLLYEEVGGRQIFKAVDISALTQFAGVTARYEYLPVMAEEFHLVFKTEEDAADAEAKLRALRLDDGTVVMRLVRDGERLFGGCAIGAFQSDEISVHTPQSNHVRRFNELFYPLTGLKSGRHHRDGLLWIRTPSKRHREVERRIPLRQVMPSLLDLCGIDTAGRFAFPPLPELHDRELVPA
jgi:hypothetical protein